MADAFSRSLSAIDCDMRTLLTLNRDAEQQLHDLRHQLEQMQLSEYNIVCAIEARRTKFDRLLDERLRSRGSDGVPTDMPTGQAMAG